MSGKNYPAVSGSSPDEYYEDELVTWLQYPSEDSLEKGYCSDVFGQWPPTVSDNPRLLPGIGSLKASSGTDLSKLYCAQASTDETKDRVGTGPLPRTSNTEGALALGAQRAAGLAPQWGGDAFSKVRTAMQPPAVSHLTPAATKVVGKQYESVQVTVVEPASCQTSKAPLAPAHGGPHMLRSPPQSSTGVAAPAERGPVPQSMPFSASRLQSVPCAPLQTSSVHESGCSGLTELVSANQVGSKHASSAISGGDLYISKGSGAMPVSRPASISVLADRRTVAELVSLASSSGLSPACTTLSSRDASSYSGKRKFEDSESHSEYVQDVAVELSMDVKQPRKTSKKNRASEVHNLSERNRRNRINEKLKALQDLIPDASKTDKASILDEAIEYMKTLQMQLQMVSMRSGMHVSSMMIPLGMPHLQMDPFHPVGLGVPVGPPGMGMGMGLHMSMGMGMMEMPQGIMTRALSIAPNQFSVPYLGRSVGGSQGCDLDYMNIVSAPSQFAHAAQNPPEPFSQMRLAAESLPRAHLQQQQEQWQYSGEPSCGSESVKHYKEKVSRKE